MGAFSAMIYFVLNNLNKKREFFLVYIFKQKSIKQSKRKKSLGIETSEDQEDFKSRCYKLLTTNKLTKDGLIQACLLEGRKYTSVLTELNRMLKNNGETKTVKDFYRTTHIQAINNNLGGGISDIVPSL